MDTKTSRFQNIEKNNIEGERPKTNVENLEGKNPKDKTTKTIAENCAPKKLVRSKFMNGLFQELNLTSAGFLGTKSNLSK